MGRNEQELARLKAHVERGLIYGSRSSGLIETVPITGDEAVDTAALRAFGTIDAVLDFSPPQAAGASSTPGSSSSSRLMRHWIWRRSTQAAVGRWCLLLE
ncbi:hypothetical protein PG988_002179 [Apiospora saccharicola]